MFMAMTEAMKKVTAIAQHRVDASRAEHSLRGSIDAKAASHLKEDAQCSRTSAALLQGRCPLIAPKSRIPNAPN